MTAPPDDPTAAGTARLRFIADTKLRETVGLDINAATSHLARGDWSEATARAGSAVEAMLYSALSEHDRTHVGAIAGAIVTLTGNVAETLSLNLEERGWGLHQYVEVAAQLRLISADAAQLARRMAEFRNPIHPRSGAQPSTPIDESTALEALAAVKAVARDLAG